MKVACALFAEQKARVQSRNLWSHVPWRDREKTGSAKSSGTSDTVVLKTGGWTGIKTHDELVDSWSPPLASIPSVTIDPDFPSDAGESPSISPSSALLAFSECRATDDEADAVLGRFGWRWWCCWLWSGRPSESPNERLFEGAGSSSEERLITSPRGSSCEAIFGQI